VKVNLRGSTLSLRRYASKLRAVGSDTVLRRFADNLAEEGLDLIAEGFSTETNPYGARWRRKVFADGRQVLVGNTTRLRRGWHRKYIAANGFALAPSVNYAKYHQRGIGIYGPSRSRIEPIRAKALSFTVQRAVAHKSNAIVSVGRGRSHAWKSQRVFFMSVEGAPPRLMFPVTKTLPQRWKRGFNSASKEFWTAYFAKK
jgi:hypothetical protein